MSQPVWNIYANPKKSNQFENGGFFVLVENNDPSEADGIFIEIENEKNPVKGSETYRIFWFTMNKCSIKDGILVNNNCHSEISPWWTTNENGSCLKNIPNYSEEQLIADLCNPDAIKRAEAYQAIGNHFTFYRFDANPLTNIDLRKSNLFQKNLMKIFQTDTQ